MYKLNLMDDTAESYFLQVLRVGEEPQWSEPAEELKVGSQEIGGGFVQHWAYPKDSPHQADDLPPAEALAGRNPAPTPAILIDQEPDNSVTLILTKDGHAWGHTNSNLSNLEGNITTLLGTAKEKFNLHIEHFMTTDRVTPEVERKLDELEEVEDEVEKGESREEVMPPAPAPSLKSALSEEGASFSPRINPTPFGSINSQPKKRSSAVAMLIPIIVLIALAGGAFMFKDQIFSKLKSTPAPTPTLAPTSAPSPTPTLTAVKRSDFTIRVLNGTAQTGAASKLAAKLENLGWKTTGVGNATNSAFLQTEVRGKSGQDNLIKTLIFDLAPDLNATAGAALKDNDKADAEVVIGQK